MSGAPPPLRSLWFGEGLTSATTEDSGRNSDATMRAPLGRLQEPLLAHDERLLASGAGHCAETTMRDKLIRGAPAWRLRRIRGCCCRRAAPLKNATAGPACRRPDRPTPGRLSFRLRYSLDVPDNTQLTHRPRQHATWL